MSIRPRGFNPAVQIIQHIMRSNVGSPEPCWCCVSPTASPALNLERAEDFFFFFLNILYPRASSFEAILLVLLRGKNKGHAPTCLKYCLLVLKWSLKLYNFELKPIILKKNWANLNFQYFTLYYPTYIITNLNLYKINLKYLINYTWNW